MIMYYTLVRHSAYGYKGDPQFKQGLEIRQVSSKAELAKVAKAGGLLLRCFDAADRAADTWFTYMDKPWWTMIPEAHGRFSALQIDQLDIYIPAQQDLKILIDKNVEFTLGGVLFPASPAHEGVSQ